MPHWSQLKDDELLELRLCDLELSIEQSGLGDWINDFYAQLSERGLLFKPKFFLADEWFVPEGDTIIGIPFYLAHHRLRGLELKMMHEVEGGDHESFMKLVRHEMGHAFFYAYHLKGRRKFKQIFGTYPSDQQPFRPKPYSKNFVRHLEGWYAQSHPDEDFAETFAVWLSPSSNWQEGYRGWGALNKLTYIDSLMKELSHTEPPHRSDQPCYEAQKLTLKLKTYYQRKRKEYATDFPDFFDRDLKRLFQPGDADRRLIKAQVFLLGHKRLIINQVSRWSGERKFAVYALLDKLLGRCQELDLRVCHDELTTMVEVVAYLTSIVSHYRFTGRYGLRR